MTNNDEKHGKLTTGAPANLGRRAAMDAGLAAAVAVVAGLATNNAWAASAKKKVGSKKTLPKNSSQKTLRKTSSQKTFPKVGSKNLPKANLR